MVTSVSSTTASTATTASSAQASAKAAAQALISSLGSGSGVDTNSLANNLVEAERSPQKAAIQGKIDKSNAVISGFGAVNFVLGNLQTAFGDLKDLSDYSSIAPSNSQPSAFNVTAGGNVLPGSHSVVVNSLAKAQRSVSDGLANLTDKLNNGNGFTLNVNVHGKPYTVTLPQVFTKPADVVTAINSSASGLKAQIINTGDPAAPNRIMVTGPTGEVNDFTIESDDGTGHPVPGLSFTTKQTASNANLVVDGVAITSTSNQIKNAIGGVTLDLFSTTTGTEGALVDMNRDTSGVKTKIQALVTAYNETMSMLGVVSDPKSTVEGYGATLVGNSTVSAIRSQVRGMVVSAEFASGSISALRDIGVSIDKAGKLQMDGAKLDTALQNNFDDVVKMLSNNQQDQTKFSDAPRGIAGEAYKNLGALLDPVGGTLKTLSDNQSQKITSFQKQLDALEARMAVLLKRYTDQFASMNSLVGQIKSTQTGLKSSFDGMMASYTNK